MRRIPRPLEGVAKGHHYQLSSVFPFQTQIFYGAIHTKTDTFRSHRIIV
ncbi:hypothetical protein XBKQ1_660003 [Xenorhabdus bovienii str. kraussei Quebec]|uniref:Uncharacterized protein n=1 Tax=Xenorhabdus bovienii str. kraussei Quebec TaxID=1398203 RepID=A0A077PLY2_XENBV|nr:hypothetical protein XBKQ1_660003 [Xenorhabdus bovienii str. kraussei Quebec]